MEAPRSKEGALAEGVLQNVAVILFLADESPFYDHDWRVNPYLSKDHVANAVNPKLQTFRIVQEVGDVQLTWRFVIGVLSLPLVNTGLKMKYSIRPML